MKKFYRRRGKGNHHNLPSPIQGPLTEADIREAWRRAENKAELLRLENNALRKEIESSRHEIESLRAELESAHRPRRA